MPYAGRQNGFFARKVRMNIGDSLTLRAEPDNLPDAFAVRIERRGSILRRRPGRC